MKDVAGQSALSYPGKDCRPVGRFVFIRPFQQGAQNWVRACERLNFIKFVPVDNEIARVAVSWPSTVHGDPADRIIMATAAFVGCPLATKDARIRGSRAVPTVW